MITTSRAYCTLIQCLVVGLSVICICFVELFVGWAWLAFCLGSLWGFG